MRKMETLGELFWTLSQKGKKLGSGWPHARWAVQQMAAAVDGDRSWLPVRNKSIPLSNTRRWGSEFPSHRHASLCKVRQGRTATCPGDRPSQCHLKRFLSGTSQKSFSHLSTSPWKGVYDFLPMGTLTGLGFQALYCHLISSKVGSQRRKGRQEMNGTAQLTITWHACQ